MNDCIDFLSSRPASDEMPQVLLLLAFSRNAALVDERGWGVKRWIGENEIYGNTMREIVHNGRAMITRVNRKGVETKLKRKSIVSVQSR
jgi:hypothetical protein